MGTIFNEKTGFWEAYYSERHPKTREPKTLRRRQLRSEAEARRTERELMRMIHQSFQNDVCPKWIKLVPEFTEAKKLCDWTEKTYQNAKFCLEAHTLEDWHNKRVDEISATDIKELLIRRVGNRSPSSQQTVLKFIRGAFQYAFEKRYIPANPAPNIRFKVNDKIKAVLSESQVRYLLERAKACGHEWYYHWTLALYSGLRNGELYALSWDNVDFDKKQILVNSSWNKVDGFKSTKSGDDRLVGIAPTLMTALKELRFTQYDTHFVLPRSPTWEKGEQARILRTFLEGIGLPQVRFHDLRATWATILLSKGVEPIKVMTMGGWKQLKTMMIYIRKAGVDLHGVMDVLDLHDHCLKGADVLDFNRKEEM